MPHGREVLEVEALVTDRYLDSLLFEPTWSVVILACRTADPAVALVPDRVAGRDRIERPCAPRQRRSAGLERLTRDLPRFHPSFRFEERLAVRLAEAAAASHLPLAAMANRRPA